MIEGRDSHGLGEAVALSCASRKRKMSAHISVSQEAGVAETWPPERELTAEDQVCKHRSLWEACHV